MRKAKPKTKVKFEKKSFQLGRSGPEFCPDGPGEKRGSGASWIPEGPKKK